MVVQNYALFIEKTDTIYKKYSEDNNISVTKLKEFQSEIFLSLSECRKEIDPLIGHQLMERLFGTDQEVNALYYQ